MGEIIKIEIDDIVVGLDDGSVVRVKLSDVNFIPQIGDKVKVFKADDGYLVSKIKENNKRAVNKVAYVLLAFFLGGIGAHKFYSGKIGTGIVYLIFSWTFIPSIIAFVEFIIALTKTSDEYGNIYV
mgnify:CR=1 FL=1